MKEEIWNIIIKRLTAQETVVSKTALDSWIAESPENVKKYEQIKSLWQLTGQLEPEQAREIPVLTAQSKSKKIRSNNYWPYGIAAAIAAVVCIFGLNLFYNLPFTNIEWNTQTANAGKMLSITLPDSSIVLLNSESSIRYPKAFTKGDTRLIQLNGEAFFDVKHRSKQPFIVESGKIKTVVYGTSFNIRAYKSEAYIQIGVKTGKVGVLKNEKTESSKPIFLTPNKSLTFDTLAGVFSKTLSLKNEADNWTKGSLIFDETPILEVLATLSRKFDVNFNTKGYNYTSCKLTARFEHKDLPSILKTIQTVMNIKINQNGQTIYLEGGNACK